MLSSDRIQLKTVPSTLTVAGLPVPIVECRSFALDVSLLSLTVLVLALNQGYFTLYFILYGREHKGKYLDSIISSENCSELDELKYDGYSLQHLAWIAGDLIAVLAMAALPVLAIYYRKSGGTGCSKALSNVRYASVSWLVYSIVFDIKIICSIQTFLPILQYLEECEIDDTDKFGVDPFVLNLCGSSIVFFLLAISHHAHTKEVREMIHNMVEITTFDILDGIHFLTILFNHQGIPFLTLHRSVENVIVALVCINFLLPSISLMKLFHRLSNDDKKVRRSRLLSLIGDNVNVCAYLLFINLPYLLIRCYLWTKMKMELSVFLIKNAIMIFVELRQIWVYSRRIWKFRQVHTSPVNFE